MGKIQCVAHRGASLYAPENTLAAFRMAADMGAEMIETDVRQSADGKIVVYHDAFIKIPDGCDVQIENMSLSALQDIPLQNNERIPSFEAVVSLCRELNLGIYLEIKETSEALTRAMIDILKQAHMLDKTILFSNRPDYVFFVKVVEPAAQTAFSYRQAGIDPLLIAQACRADGLNLAWEDYPDPHTLIAPDWLARVRRAGLRIMSWHEERADELKALVALGLDDICTNDPALAHRLIVEETNQLRH